MSNCISQSNVRTKKEHQCWGCGKLFPAGTEMERNVSVDMGKIFSSYFCDICTGFLDSLPVNEMPEDLDFGMLKEWDGYQEYASKNGDNRNGK